MHTNPQPRTYTQNLEADNISTMWLEVEVGTLVPTMKLKSYVI